MEPIMNSKKERLKLTPEQLFDIYLECNAPGAPVKPILERYGLRPWDLVAIRKKVKAAAMDALAHPGKQGRYIKIGTHPVVSQRFSLNVCNCLILLW